MCIRDSSYGGYARHGGGAFSGKDCTKAVSYTHLMGSRYGGLKQIDPVDPYGNKIIDFSIYDAVERCV